MPRFPIPHPYIYIYMGWEWESVHAGDARVRVVHCFCIQWLPHRDGAAKNNS